MSEGEGGKAAEDGGGGGLRGMRVVVFDLSRGNGIRMRLQLVQRLLGGISEVLH